jgi:hypothetical protein
MSKERGTETTHTPWVAGRRAACRALHALCLAACLGMPGAVVAQTPDGWDWAVRMYSSRTEYGNDIAVDSLNGMVYTGGVNEDGYWNVLGGVWALLFGSSTNDDGYLAKQNLNGAVQWQIMVGGTGDDAITGVCTDPAGNVYATGWFTGSNASFTGVSGTDERMTSAGGTDVFVVCYSASGVLQWKMRAGDGSDDMASGICWSGGKLFVTGSFKGAPAMAGLPTTATGLSVANRSHAFLLALQATDGSGLWRLDGVNGEDSRFNAVAADASAVYTLGVHKGSSYDLAGSNAAETVMPVASGNLSGDVVAVDLAGNVLWAQEVSNPGDDNIQALGIAACTDAVYITGSTHDGSTFPGGSTVNTAPACHDHGYLARLEKWSGNTQWVRPLIGGSDHTLFGTDLTTDDHGDALLSGTYQGSLTYQGSTYSGLPINQVFLIKFSASGEGRWGMSPAGAGADRANGVATDRNGKVFLTGSFTDDITFITPWSSNSSQNIFIARLKDLDHDVVSYRDPSHFAGFGPVCSGQGPIDLSTLLIPLRTGNGASVLSSNGVLNPPGMLGQSGDGVASFSGTPGDAIVDMGDTIPAGENLVIRWRSGGGTANLNVGGAMMAAGAYTDQGNLSTTSTAFGLMQVTATVPMRYIRLTRLPGANFTVDGLFYKFGSDTTGTWTGPGVSGTYFDPYGLSGNVPITYTAQGYSTTHVVMVDQETVAGTIQIGGTVCPGSDVALNLSGVLATTIHWLTSTNGGTTWNVDQTDQDSHTLNNVVQATWVTTKEANGTCPGLYSDTIVVTPLDTVPPLITGCPGNILVHADGGSCGTVVNYLPPTSTDACGAVVLAVDQVAHQPGSTFPVGSTTVQYTATDLNGNSALCTFTVDVLDTVAPLISCPADVVAPTNSGCTATGVNLGIMPALANDNCGVATVTNDAPGTFPIGVTVVTWTATDNSGNTATCTQNVTVTDNVNPTIGCPAAVAATTNSGCTATGVALGTPVSGDNCGVANVTNNAPAAFPIGTTTITWTVTDNSGNTTTCTQNVTVTDNENPAISCPAAVTVATNSGCTASGVALGTPVTSDNCGVANVTNNAPAAFPIGVTTVTWTVTDNSGNTATCTQNVTVTDNENPAISCPAAVAATTNSGCTATGVALGTPVASDNCGVANVTNNAPAAFPIGTTTITWTVTDNSGNTATCSQTVTVIDDVAPVAVCQNVTVSLDSVGNANVLAAQVDNGSSDNCGSANLTLSTTQYHAIGTYSDTLTATDAFGNTGFCLATITVVDNSAPVALCNDTTLYLDAAGNASLAAAELDGGSTDNGVITAWSASQTSFTCSDMGPEQVTLTVTDNGGNSSSCTSVVTILDTLAPYINCNDLTKPLDANGWAVMDSSIVDTWGDNCMAGLYAWANPDSINVPGQTMVTVYIADASGNVDSCMATITVTDDLPPAALCQNTTLYLDAFGMASITPADLDGGSADNGTITAMAASQTSFTCADVGTLTDTLYVTDGGGNTSFCLADVTVIDTVAPTALCQPITVQLDAGGNASLTSAQVDNGSSDNCAIASLTLDITSFSCSDIGANTVTLTATDVNGNSSSCTATITVQDNLGPTISCPAALSVPTNSGCTATAVALGTRPHPTTALWFP